MVRADNDPGCVVDPPVYWHDKSGAALEVMWDDRDLRPLRDNDGEDEVLRLVGRPVGTPQAASSQADLSGAKERR
jgi:hypothetical protein